MTELWTNPAHIGVCANWLGDGLMMVYAVDEDAVTELHECDLETWQDVAAKEFEKLHGEKPGPYGAPMSVYRDRRRMRLRDAMESEN